MSDQRNTQREAKEFSRWLIDRHHSNYGENDYVVLRGAGKRGVNFVYLFAGHVVVDGGTANHQNALRRILEEEAEKVTVGTREWLVIGPAHDGERRAIPFTTETCTSSKIKADDGFQRNDARAVPGAL